MAGPPLWLWWQADRLPRIHDVGTDTDDPPRFVAVLPLRKDARNSTDHSAATAAQQTSGYPDLTPLQLDVPPAKAQLLAERAARAMGWGVIALAAAAWRCARSGAWAAAISAPTRIAYGRSSGGFLQSTRDRRLADCRWPSATALRHSMVAVTCSLRRGAAGCSNS